MIPIARSLQRITREHLNLQHDPPETISAGLLHDSDPRQWQATVEGPPNTPYAQGTFNISLQFPESYPREPPHVAFSTLIFHPNVSLRGEVRLAELEQTQWSPAFTVRTILLSLQAILSDPNLLEGCVMNDEAAGLFLGDVEGFNERARQWTMAYAGSQPDVKGNVMDDG